VSNAVTAHIFQNHELKPGLLLPIESNLNAEVWPSVFLLVCLCMLALIKAQGFAKAVRIVQSTFSNQVLQQLDRADLRAIKVYSVGLSGFFILNVSFLLYKLNTFYGFVLYESDSLIQFLFFLFAVTIVSAFKSLFNSMLAFFSDERRLFTVYTTNSTLVNQTFGLFLFPWIVLIEFSDFDPLFFISGALIILSLGILLKWYRGVIMSLVEERIGLLQIFSYFCGLEILPLFVLSKFAIETF